MTTGNVSVSKEGADHSRGLSIATFFMGNVVYGIDILAVQEIFKWGRATMVPLSPDYVTGVLNLRGRIVTIIDLANRLGAPPEALSNHGHVIMVGCENESVGLKVDGIGDVIETSWDRVEPPPANLKGVHRNFVRGVLKINDRLVELLDLGAVLEVE